MLRHESRRDSALIKAVLYRAPNDPRFSHKRNLFAFQQPPIRRCLDTEQVVLDNQLHPLHRFILSAEHHLNIVARTNLARIYERPYFVDDRVGRRWFHTKSRQHGRESIAAAQFDAYTWWLLGRDRRRRFRFMVLLRGIYKRRAQDEYNSSNGQAGKTNADARR